MDELVRDTRHLVGNIDRVIAGHGLEIVLATVDVSTDICCAVYDHRHALNLHLDGVLAEYQYELDGCGFRPAPLRRGEVSVVPAGRRYAIRTRGAPGTVARYAELFFDPTLAIDRTGRTLEPRRITACFGTRDEFLHGAVRYLAQLADADDDIARMTSQTLCHAIYLNFFRTYGAPLDPRTVQTPCAPVGMPKRVRVVQEYVHAHLGDRLTLERLSSAAGLTVNDLIAVFRTHLHVTPAQYVIQQRLRAARRLLEATSKDITSIAHALGFSSHSHLTTTFKTRFGMTPREFRRQRRGRQAGPDW